MVLKSDAKLLIILWQGKLIGYELTGIQDGLKTKNPFREGKGFLYGYRNG